LGQTEVHLRLGRGPVGLNKVLTEAGHLTGRRHLYTEVGVGTSQPSPGELGDLGSDVVPLDSHQISGLGDVAANEGLGGNIDEVGTEDLTDEGE